MVDQQIEEFDLSTTKTQADRIIRLNELEQTIGLKRSWIYDAMTRGEFPKQIPLGRRSVGWKASDVQRWIEAREEVARARHVFEKKKQETLDLWLTT